MHHIMAYWLHVPCYDMALIVTTKPNHGTCSGIKTLQDHRHLELHIYFYLNIQTLPIQCPCRRKVHVPFRRHVGLLQLNYTQKLLCYFKSKPLAKSQHCVLQIHTTEGQFLVTCSHAVFDFVKYVSRDIWSAPEFLLSLLSCSTKTWVSSRPLSCLWSTCAYLQLYGIGRDQTEPVGYT